MEDFALHPRLDADTHRLGRLDLSLVLLHQDAGVPWYLLVPNVHAAELIEPHPRHLPGSRTAPEPPPAC